jgi:hypothetical protein
MKPANAVAGVKGFVSISLESRFWAKVDRRGPDECWPWLGSKICGYGIISQNNRCRRASQISWEIHNGAPFPSGKMACHSCDNPECVNPDHIWPGTMRDNMQDALKKGRLDSTARFVINHNREKTHCHKGHPLSGANMKIMKSGSRYCRECHKRHARESRQRIAERKAAAALAGSGE